jgi:hypothetical protein
MRNTSFPQSLAALQRLIAFVAVGSLIIALPIILV